MERSEFLEQAARLVKRSCGFSVKARGDGLSALEPDIDAAKVESRDIFEYGIRLAVDGAEVQNLQTILSELVAQEPDGYAQRLKQMQKEAVLSILKGENTHKLACRIAAYIDGPFDTSAMRKACLDSGILKDFSWMTPDDFKIFEGSTPKWAEEPDTEKRAFFAEEAVLAISMAEEFSQTATREGILALEDALESVDDLFFKFALYLLVNGFDSNTIDEILSIRISVELDAYVRRLRSIQKEIVLCIQAKESTDTLLPKLMSRIDTEDLQALREPGAVKTALGLCRRYETYGPWVLQKELQIEADRRKRMERDNFEYGVYLSAINPGYTTMERSEFLEQAARITKRSYGFSVKAIRDGIWALEPYIDAAKMESWDVFEYGMRFAVDGAQAQNLQTILSELVAQEPDGYAQRLKQMQKEAVLSILKGESPRVLVYRITAYIDGPFDTLAFCKARPDDDTFKDSGWMPGDSYIFEGSAPKPAGVPDTEKRAFFAEEAVSAISTAVKFNDMARKEGILALEDEHENIDDRFFKFALRMVLDGVDYKTIDEILSIRISVEPEAYVRRLRTIQKEVALRIQAGENTATLLHILMSHIGAEDLEALREKRRDAKPRDDISSYILDSFGCPMDKLTFGFSREMPGAVKRALDFCRRSETYGLWTLENKIDRCKRMERDIFEYGIYLSVINTKHETVEKILSNLIALETDGEELRLKNMQLEAVRHIGDMKKLWHVLTSHLTAAGLEALRKTHPDIFAGVPVFEKPAEADTEPNDGKDKSFAERLARIVDRAYMFWQKAGESLSAMREVIDESKVARRDILEYGLWLYGPGGVHITRSGAHWSFDSCGNVILSNLIAHEQDGEERRLKTIQKEFVRSMLYDVKGFLSPLMSHVTSQELEALGKMSKIFSDTDDACFYLPVGFEPANTDDESFVHGLSRIVKRAIEADKAQREGIVTVDDKKRSHWDVFECGLHLAECEMNDEKIETVLTNMISLERDAQARRLKEAQKKAVMCIHRKLHPIEFLHVMLSGIDNGELAALLEHDREISDLFRYDGAGNADIERERSEGKSLALKPMKGNKFTFADMLALRNSDMQKVLRKTDPQKLATALAGADGEIHKKIFANMSVRAAVMLKDNIRIHDAESADKAGDEIAGMVRKLEDAGEIIIPSELMSAEACMDMVRSDGQLLQCVPQKLVTAELCLEALKSSGEAFEHVPENLKTFELCLEVAKRNIGVKHLPPEFTEEIRKRVFRLEDITDLDDASVAKAFNLLEDNGELAKALKLAGNEVHEKALKNMPESRAAMLREDMEYMGPIRRMDAEDAAGKVCAVFFELEKKGEIKMRQR